LQQGTTATHHLVSHHQQARVAARHHSHSQTGEARTGTINRLEVQKGTTVTHYSLERQGQASSAGQNCSKAPVTHILESQGQAQSAG
jgi:hypothetical protein